MPRPGAILLLALTVLLTAISVELFYIALAARDVHRLLSTPIVAPASAPALTDEQRREENARDIDRAVEDLKWYLNRTLDGSKGQPSTPAAPRQESRRPSR